MVLSQVEGIRKKKIHVHKVKLIKEKETDREMVEEMVEKKWKSDSFCEGLMLCVCCVNIEARPKTSQELVLLE